MAPGVTFDAAGAEKMRQATARHVGELIAMLIDGEVISTPRPAADQHVGGDQAATTQKKEAERIANGMRSQ